MATYAVTTFFARHDFDGFIQNVRQKSSHAYKKCEKVWGYVGKASRVVHMSLNASLKSCFTFTLGCKGVDNQVKRVIAGLKVFSVFGLPFACTSIVSTA